MARRTLVILLLVFAVSHMDRQLLAILIEPVKRELGMSDSAAACCTDLPLPCFSSGWDSGRAPRRSLQPRASSSGRSRCSVQ